MLERIDLLMSQGRYQMAYDITKDALSEEPNNSDLLSILATCALNLNKLKEAKDLTKELIAKEPWNSYHFYLRAHVYLKKNEYRQALEYLDEAIQKSANYDVYYELKARILFHLNEFKQAEDTVKIALSINSQNVEAVNLLARIYNAQGRRQDSEQLMNKVLEQDPENVESHTNYGMQYLEKGNVAKAIEHFQTALFNSPTDAYAQEGMKLAMKAKFPLYRWLLQFQLFMSKQSSQINFLLIIGIIVIMRSIRSLSEIIGGIAVPLGYTIVGILLLFVLSTWILDSIMTFVLYTQKHGRLSLNEREIKLAKFTGLNLACIGLSLVLGIVFNNGVFLNLLGVGFLGLLVSQNIVREMKRPRNIAMVFYGVGALSFIGSLLTSMVGSFDSSILSSVGVLVCVAYTWLGQSWGRR